MKTILKIALLLAVVIWCPETEAQNGTSEQLVIPLSSPGQPYSLKVNIIEGSIKVVSYEGKDVVIDVKTPSENKKDVKEVENGMRRISSSGRFDLTAKENDNRISINTGNPEQHYDLNIRIPQGEVNLQLGSVNDGNIEVENVTGELEVTTVDGDLVLRNISGSAVCNTVDGDITVNFVKINPQAPMAFSTLDGNINVSFPSDIKANFKLKSDMGEVYTDFEIDIDKSAQKAQKISESGVYKVKLENWIFGKVNGGGPEIMMKNMDGNIYVKKAGK